VKRNALFVGAGLVVVLFVAWYAIFAGTADIEDGLELAGFARTVKDGQVSIFVLDAGAGKLALVDAGDDPEGKALLGELKRRGADKAAVAAIFLTHGHADHIAACHLMPNARVYVGEGDVALAEGREPSKGPLPRLLGKVQRDVKVARGLHDGEVVDVGDLAVRAFAVPGHTAGSMAFLVRGVLFLGDSADAMRDGRLVAAKWLFSDDTAQNRASL
jgi:glyoxylase-like metal-dependent hydrolase (beta-lactamase superfamily II)